MSATASGELTASTVIGLIESGAYPRDVVATIARGFLPLPQEELIGVLVYLATVDDAEIVGYSREALQEIPTRAIFDYASNERTAPEHLMRLLSVATDNVVVEALIRNKAVSDSAIADLARTADAGVQEVIVINQARIIRAPGILDALLENAALSPDVRRRALETKEEFFEKKARIELENAEEPELIEAPLEVIADLLEKAAEITETAPTLVQLTEGELNDPKKGPLWTRLMLMTISEKVMVAYRGDRTARMLLVRDRNKLICSAVMRNPRMTDQEAENIASMRNVEEEVLRLLGMRRDWMSKYNIMLTLVRNPKTPVGVVLPFVNRLTLRDLKGLKDDRGVQAVVRDLARKAFLMRTAKK
ncbi:MAG TPA: hypothetical protein VGQ76_27265 [Thermoanaerobaculia bacterium]|jgi:hypothetical protein|nr:hypothetical protein [Thermoanaerobaculia bacterium]